MTMLAAPNPRAPDQRRAVLEGPADLDRLAQELGVEADIVLGWSGRTRRELEDAFARDHPIGLLVRIPARSVESTEVRPESSRAAVQGGTLSRDPEDDIIASIVAGSPRLNTASPYRGRQPAGPTHEDEDDAFVRSVVKHSPRLNAGSKYARMK